jgi:hypothetical protein
MTTVTLPPLPCPVGAEEYSFDLDEFEKKKLEWGGYSELKGEHQDINQDSSFTLLNSGGDSRSSLDRLTSTFQFDGKFQQGIAHVNWVMQTYGRLDQEQWEDNADIFEAYVNIQPSPAVTIELGKKVAKWGKGYAWNPVGFIARPKDPNNPEDAMEGYLSAGVDLIKSFSGSLRTVALTAAVLPVWEDFNEDFGVRDNINLAAKLYLLYHDVDIDLLWYTGDSRSTRYGLDFSTNLAENIEIHGEVAHIPNQSGKVLDPDSAVEIREISATTFLLGLRYLSENDITTIVEYYHNDAGYTQEEQEHFYQLVNDADLLYQTTGDDALRLKAASVSQGGYGQPQSGRNYLYTRMTKKEPFSWLYFTPGVTAIVNLDDTSYSISPEATYTGFTNWELRFRLSFLEGGSRTDYGEKQNEQRLELRTRYFF